MTDQELIRRGDVRTAILEYLEETGSELERWDIDQIVSGIAAIDPAAIREAALQARIEELGRSRKDLEKLSIKLLNEKLQGEWREPLVAELEAAEAKLAKAVEALRGILKGDDMYPWRIAREAMAELEKK